MGAPGKRNSVTVGDVLWLASDGPDLSLLDSVYRLPVQSPSATAKEVKSRALDLQPVLDEVQVKHPLVRAGNPK